MQKRLIPILFCLFLTPLVSLGDFECSITDIEGKTDAQLEVIAAQCEKEAAEHKALLEEKQQESVTIERDISILNYKIKKTKVDIRTTQVKIYQIGQEITEKEKDLRTLSEKTEETINHLAVLIKRKNELDAFSSIEALLSQKTLSNFFLDVNDFDEVEEALKNNLNKLRDVKNKTEKVKEDLESAEMNERGLKIQKEKEAKQTESYKRDKENLLSLNREQEAEYQSLIEEKERVKNAIRNRLFRTVGGAELTFGEALRLIQPYEEKIGVEAALTLSILSQESGIDGLIGKNQGRCTYNQPATNKAGTVMSDSQKTSFLAILGELEMDPETTPVSCPIYSDGAYGGAMGPSQFMPNTWWNEKNGTGYKHRVAKVLGVAVPSPFNNLDAFTGTALYLSDAMYRCKTAFSGQFDLWSCSAAKYYSGLYNTTSNTLLNHMRPTYSYGYKVAKRAQEFQKDIDLLNN